MSEQLNPLNIQANPNNRQVYFQSNNNAPSGGVMSMQGVPQNLGETEMGNRINNSSELTQSPYTVPVTAAVWYGLAQGMEKINKKCCGTYDDSLLGKVTNAADNLSNKITESKFCKSRFSQWMAKRYDGVKGFLDRITNNPKNRVLYALRNTSTSPECKMVKIPAAGLDGFLIADTKQVFEEFLKPAKNAIELKQYGKDDAYIQKITEAVKNLPKEEKLKVLQAEELKCLGVEKSEIAGKSAEEVSKIMKEAKVKKLGFNNFKHYEQFLDDDYALKHLKELTDILKKGDQKLKIMIWKKDGALGKVTSHLFGREVGVSELANKMAICSKTGAKTTLGKYVGKMFGYLLEGSSCRFAGGKIAAFMQATIFADMLIHTFKAPKGEKGKTFIERAVNDFTYFMAMPIGIWAMHKAGGLKYAGMTKEQVAAYRQNLKLFNERADLKNLSKKSYKMRSKVLDRQLKAGVKNPFVWLLKKCANFLTIGLERIRPYQSKSAGNLNLLRKFKYFSKDLIGYPLRFIIPIMIISPFLAKLTTKAAHLIFGRPTESVLDEGKDDKNKEEEQENNVNNGGQQDVINRNPNDYPDTNLIKMTLNGQKLPERTYVPNPQGMLPQENDRRDTEPEPVRTYIPSPQGMVPVQQDLSAIDEALAQADNAERFIQSTLKML